MERHLALERAALGDRRARESDSFTIANDAYGVISKFKNFNSYVEGTKRTQSLQLERENRRILEAMPSSRFQTLAVSL